MHGRMNYKDTEPYISAFFNRLCGILLNRLYRLEINLLLVGIFDPACELLPPWTKEPYLCTVAPLLYLLSDLLPPTSFLKLNVQYVQTVCGWGGGGVMICTVDHILQGFYTLFLTRFRTYKIASPPQTKMTSKDDIKRLVSLKFLRPWRHACSIAAVQPYREWEKTKMDPVRVNVKRDKDQRALLSSTGHIKSINSLCQCN
jgi:hypothetical protein